MPSFVPPPSFFDFPPASIQISIRDRKPSSPWLAQVPPSANPPAVVEFYYSPPQSVPKAPTDSPRSGHNATAIDLLGQPITGHPASSQPTSTAGEVTTPESASSAVVKRTTLTRETLVLMGLNRLGNLPDYHRSRRLMTQIRGQAPQIFTLAAASSPETTAQSPPAVQGIDNAKPVPVPGESSPNTPIAPAEKELGVIELIADRQEYDSTRKIIYAQGNVEMRFANAILLADRLRVNMNDRLAVAEGAVVLKRGDQTIRGQRFEYYFVQDSGVIFNANGEIFQPSTGQDFSPGLPTDLANQTVPNQTLSDRLAANQPLQQIAPAQGFGFSAGTSFNTNNINQGTSGGLRGGKINRVRFQAEQINFDKNGWVADNIRLTNDPFSPPELEIKAKNATFRNIAPQVDEVRMSDSQVIFDQENSVPTFQDRLILDRRSRQPGAISFGYDGKDRGGLYIQSNVTLIDNDAVHFEINPQFLIQKALFPSAFPTEPSFNVLDTQNGVLSPGVFGAVTDLEVNFDPRTNFNTRGSFSSFDFTQLENNVRANVTLQRLVGDLNSPYDLRLEYNYRERLFNGTLGFQTVNNSYGAIAVSPEISLGNGLTLSYQGSIQNIQAATDQYNLLPPNPTNNLVTLMRYQAAASVRNYTNLWLGEVLPPTPEEGLKYTPNQIQPYLQLQTGVTGVASYYSSGNSQPSLTGSIGLVGQFGHFSKPYLDYTGFSLIFSQALRGSQSPFFFDRYVDTQTLSWGLTQQIYGPVRFGAQGSINLGTNQEISTDYFLEYSRRSYNILVRYNPVLEVGSINLRISDFNWSGNPGPFDGTGIRPVIDGVTR